MSTLTLVTADTPRGVNVAGHTQAHGVTVTGVLCPDCARHGIVDACGRPVLDPARGSMQPCGRYEQTR